MCPLQNLFSLSHQCLAHNLYNDGFFTRFEKASRLGRNDASCAGINENVSFACGCLPIYREYVFGISGNASSQVYYLCVTCSAFRKLGGILVQRRVHLEQLYLFVIVYLSVQSV